MERESRNFITLLQERWALNTSVCIGLDSDYEKIPVHLKKGDVTQSILSFNTGIIDATHDAVCAYKMQIAYYEACGAQGITALIETANYVKETYPAIPLILDAKRADIGATNSAYVKAVFEVYGYDAVTLHPYLGKEALQSFLDQKNKGCIILCRTSNRGAGEFQDLLVDGEPLYIKVARQVKEVWNTNENCAVVAGATHVQELREIRAIVGDMPILIPGIGSQGGDVEQTVKAGKNSKGNGMIINSSRNIIFASQDTDFTNAARQQTLQLRDEINRYI